MAGRTNPSASVRPVGPTTAGPDRDPGEPALVRPRPHLAAALGGQFTENLGVHGSSSAPGEPGLAPHILKIRRKAPPPTSGECLIFPAQKGLGRAKPRGVGGQPSWSARSVSFSSREPIACVCVFAWEERARESSAYILEQIRQYLAKHGGPPS